MSLIGITNNYQQEYSMRGVRDLKTLRRFHFGGKLICTALAMGSEKIVATKSRESAGRLSNSNENCCMVSQVRLGGPASNRF